eukprot:11114493-Karenia_brevis.AAC.1
MSLPQNLEHWLHSFSHPSTLRVPLTVKSVNNAQPSTKFPGSSQMPKSKNMCKYDQSFTPKSIQLEALSSLWCGGNDKVKDFAITYKKTLSASNFRAEATNALAFAKDVAASSRLASKVINAIGWYER